MIRRFCSAIIRFVAFVIAAGISLHYGYDCVLCYNSQDWKTAKGIVTFNGEDDLPLGDLFRQAPQLAKKIPAEYANKTLPLHVVRYKYKIDGKIFSGDKVAFGRVTLLDSLPIDIGNRKELHPKGKRITVTYDPSNPETCVLDPSMEQEGLITLGLSVFFAVALGGSFFLRRREY